MKEIACQDTVTVVLIFVAPLRNIKLSWDSSYVTDQSSPINCHRCCDEDNRVYENYKYHLCSLSPPTMANSFTLLGDLKAGRCSTTAKVICPEFCKPFWRYQFYRDCNFFHLFVCNSQRLCKDPWMRTVSASAGSVSLKALCTWWVGSTKPGIFYCLMLPRHTFH